MHTYAFVASRARNEVKGNGSLNVGRAMLWGFDSGKASSDYTCVKVEVMMQIPDGIE